MTKALLVAAAITLPAIAGYAAILLADKKGALSMLERVPLSFGIGAGLLSLYMFAIGMAGIKYSFAAFLPFFIAAAAILYVKRSLILKERRCPSFVGATRPTGWQIAVIAVLGLLILWKFYFAAHSAVAYPTYFDDAASTWDYKAKVIYYDKGLKGENSAEIFGGVSGAGYPLSTPLFRAWICMVAGEWNDSFAHIHSVVLFISLVILFFAFALNHMPLFTSFVFTYALTAIPLISLHAFANYAEMPMAFYLFASMVALSRWFLTGVNTYLYTACLCSFIMAFTKNEGALVFIPTLAVIFGGMLYLSKMEPAKKKKTLIISIAATCALVLPWLAVKLYQGGGLGTSGIIFEFHPEAFGEILSVLFREGSFGILWGAVFLLLALYPAGLRDRTFLSYAIPAAVILSAVLFVFIFTNNYEWLRLRTTINRTLLIAAPSIIMACAVLTHKITSVWRKKESI